MDGVGAAKEVGQPATCRQYFSLAVFTVTHLLCFMDRLTLSGVLTDIQDHFDIGDSRAGLMQTIFVCSLTIFGPLFGYLGDRHNRKWIVIVGVAIWEIAVFACSFVPGNMFWLFLVLRAVVGVGESSFVVITPTIIADTFSAASRSRMLACFFVAPPLGSGVGYVFSSALSSAFHGWQWGIRLSPVFGVIVIVLMAIVVVEPERGRAEKERGAEMGTADSEDTSFWTDVKAILRNATFMTSTLGWLTSVFVVGTLSWWAVTAFKHAYAAHQHLNDTDSLSDADANAVSLLFGGMAVVGGMLGVAAGAILSQVWSHGKLCCRRFRTSRANPLVGAIGSLITVPFFLLGTIFMKINIPVAWVFIFVAVWAMSWNWVPIADLLLDVIIPRRQNLARGMQLLIANLIGEAPGPYLVGLISDAVRGSDTSPSARYNALFHAFHFPNAALIVGAALFFVAAYLFVRDRAAYEEQMGFAKKVISEEAEGGEPEKGEIKGDTPMELLKQNGDVTPDVDERKSDKVMEHDDTIVTESLSSSGDHGEEQSHKL